MGRRIDFQEETRRQKMIKHGVESVDGNFVRDGLGRSNITQAKPNGNQGGVIGNATPRAKFKLISRFSEEGRKLVARGFGRFKR
jgi:hypothetical protein